MIRYAAFPATLGLWVVAATALHDPTVTWAAEPGEPRLDETGVLPGGHELRFRLGVGYESDVEWPITINAVTVTLRRDDGSQRELKTNLTTIDHEQVIRIRIPDINAHGWLDARVELLDRCLSYVAVGSSLIHIVPGDVAAACSSDMDAITAHYSALQQPPLEAGGVSVGTHSGTLEGLWDAFAIAADGPAFGFWDQELPPAIGQAGGAILVAEANPDLVLNRLEAFFYRRGDVVRWLDSRITDIDEVFRVTTEPAQDGSFDLALPHDPRRYVAILHFEWDSPCYRGQSRAVVAIDVE